MNVQTGVIVNQALKTAAQNDPRMSQLITNLIQLWDSEGGGLFDYYNFMQPDNNFGFWGLLTSTGEAGSQKWDALMRLALPGVRRYLDKTVSYSDFLVLKSHWGQSGQWWEDGDFNGDGIVDQKDLAILLQNITGLTPRAVRRRQSVQPGDPDRRR